MKPRPVAFVTGGASGIGRATVLRLVADGFHVAAADLNRVLLDELGGSERHITTHVADVRERSQISEAMAAYPEINALVCVAGLYQPRRFEDITTEDFRLMLDVNLIGVFIAAQEVLHHMPEGGRIVTVSSRAAIGGTNFAHYVASKAAVVGLTRAIAMELRPRRIAVNSVAPGFTDTPMTRSMPPDQYAAAQSLEPSGAAADPDDIAGAIAFLASPTTRFITGQTLFVDGGKSLGGLGM
ncbi:MAG: SDR family oxidoreductase [Chelatococcus sp.]|uniref:SDR family NAD(P)-dependent oxidoreductase n=1 Tax=unclassified Chelatococcus TaxID=2638111 RepID=UPI001BD168D7|nr:MULTISPECIES: SDR family NAD(P)-dependent oxidoreductase [unclassified Chelatococcus]CAH1661111.1 3-oxoacyl-(acyl-carrier protein) reductase [Hyphomicrobiales bacterium]MBS7741214.1 SDR family oxidoreductase [Chelatococcus sp. HY11]MBX3538415.1 SDR family oxidoreductase [Chelatococcus sp.]MBX3545400.1 SDR family oxidoreductase [Chelatococcus sp.]MCO5078036.1 SDR family oxidoreductase [Chelatococcus sp.]